MVHHPWDSVVCGRCAARTQVRDKGSSVHSFRGNNDFWPFYNLCRLAFRYPPLMVSSHSSPLSWSSVTGSTSPLKTDESRTPDTPSSTANQQPTAGNGGAHTPASVSANSSPSTSPAGIQNSSGSSDGNTDDHQLAHMVVRSGDQFANMFRPKNALCTGEILELRVDDIMFISCPILLQTKEKATKE